MEGGYHFRNKGFDFKKSIAEKIRGNASVIAAAYVHDSVDAALFVRFFNKLNSNIHMFGRRHYQEGDLLESAAFFSQNEHYHQLVNQLICVLDLGLSAIELQEMPSVNDQGESSKVVVPVGVHAGVDSSFKLYVFEESSGTKSAYVLLRMIVPVLEHGGIAVLDEIDTDLHLHMLIKLVELFKHRHTNPHNAQLLFRLSFLMKLNYFVSTRFF